MLYIIYGEITYPHRTTHQFQSVTLQFIWMKYFGNRKIGANLPISISRLQGERTAWFIQTLIKAEDKII